MKKIPIEVFGEWVSIGKDEDMEKDHEESVENMVSFATKDLTNFSFIDAGCGNGWVVRSVASLPNCIQATGIDGALKMFDNDFGRDGTTGLNIVGGTGICFVDSPNTTSATTYKTQVACSVSATASVAVQHNSAVSSITLMEIGA